MKASIDQHNLEIHENIEHWRRKPLLGRIYGEFYREIAARIDPSKAGTVLELGSGMGNIKEHIPSCITTDAFSNPWLDRVENAYALSFPNESVAHLILFDVWHHLQYPGTALREFHRVLKGGGRVIIFDPAMGLLGRIIFGLFHHEPLGLKDPIHWQAPSTFSPQDVEAHSYYAAQGNASRVFGTDVFREQLSDWRILEIRYFSALSYLASGGLRGPQLFPIAALPLMQAVDRFLSRFTFMASRMLIVLEKPRQAST